MLPHAVPSTKTDLHLRCIHARSRSVALRGWSVLIPPGSAASVLNRGVKAKLCGQLGCRPL